MEATAKSILMDCEGCSELLADFLLDELPESEAVLVHEHLLICESCMKAYRELKGTGKALEAITSMQAVEATESFRSALLAKALEESEKIVSKLPPERRLRLEARREARQSIRMSRRMPPTKVWSPGLLILALTAAIVLAVILFWPKTDKTVPRVALGKLSVALGKIELFYQKENQPHTPAEEGKSFWPGDAFTSGDLARARFDVQEGGSIFLGPASDATYRLPQSEVGAVSVLVENGEVGVLRPDNSAATTGAKNHDWEIRSGAGILSIANSTHAYIRAIKADKVSTLEVSVLAGCVHATSFDGKRTESLYAGQKATLHSADSSLTTESLADERPPAWRADLITEADLSGLLSGKAKIVSRKAGRVQVELAYNRETATTDWTSELNGVALALKGDALSCPNGVRWKNTAPFAAPLTFELKMNVDSRRETGFALGAFEPPESDVAVDVGREAVLTVHEKNKTPTKDRIAAHGPPGAERFMLQLKQDGLGYVALLTNSAGKTKAIPMWKDKVEAPGALWFQALGEGLLLDEIKISGTLPGDWIRQKLSGAQ